MTNKKIKVEKETSSKDIQIKEEVEESSEEVIEQQDYLEDLQRLQAEFQNFQVRTEKEKAEFKKSSNKELILKLVDVLNNTEKAIEHEPKNNALKIMQKSLKEILEKEGLKEINTTGKFNPEFHEAIANEESTTENSILEVYTKGYTLNDKLLKAAIVKISKLGELKNE